MNKAENVEILKMKYLTSVNLDPHPKQQILEIIPQVQNLQI